MNPIFLKNRHIFLEDSYFNNIVLVSAAQRSDSATCTGVSPLAWVSFPSSSAQSTRQQPLSCSAGSHLLFSAGRAYVSIPVHHPLSVSCVSVLPLCLYLLCKQDHLCHLFSDFTYIHSSLFRPSVVSDFLQPHEL